MISTLFTSTSKLVSSDSYSNASLMAVNVEIVSCSKVDISKIIKIILFDNKTRHKDNQRFF